MAADGRSGHAYGHHHHSDGNSNSNGSGNGNGWSIAAPRSSADIMMTNHSNHINYHPSHTTGGGHHNANNGISNAHNSISMSMGGQYDSHSSSRRSRPPSSHASHSLHSSHSSSRGIAGPSNGTNVNGMSVSSSRGYDRAQHHVSHNHNNQPGRMIPSSSMTSSSLSSSYIVSPRGQALSIPSPAPRSPSMSSMSSHGYNGASMTSIGNHNSGIAGMAASPSTLPSSYYGGARLSSSDGISSAGSIGGIFDGDAFGSGRSSSPLSSSITHATNKPSNGYTSHRIMTVSSMGPPSLSSSDLDTSWDNAPSMMHTSSLRAAPLSSLSSSLSQSSSATRRHVSSAGNHMPHVSMVGSSGKVAGSNSNINESFNTLSHDRSIGNDNDDSIISDSINDSHSQENSPTYDRRRHHYDDVADNGNHAMSSLSSSSGGTSVNMPSTNPSGSKSVLVAGVAAAGSSSLSSSSVATADLLSSHTSLSSSSSSPPSLLPSIGLNNAFGGFGAFGGMAGLPGLSSFGSLQIDHNNDRHDRNDDNHETRDALLSPQSVSSSSSLSSLSSSSYDRNNKSSNDTMLASDPILFGSSLGSLGMTFSAPSSSLSSSLGPPLSNSRSVPVLSSSMTSSLSPSIIGNNASLGVTSVSSLSSSSRRRTGLSATAAPFQPPASLLASVHASAAVHAAHASANPLSQSPWPGNVTTPAALMSAPAFAAAATGLAALLGEPAPLASSTTTSGSSSGSGSVSGATSMMANGSTIATTNNRQSLAGHLISHNHSNVHSGSHGHINNGGIISSMSKSSHQLPSSSLLSSSGGHSQASVSSSKMVTTTSVPSIVVTGASSGQLGRVADGPIVTTDAAALLATWAARRPIQVGCRQLSGMFAQLSRLVMPIGGPGSLPHWPELVGAMIAQQHHFGAEDVAIMMQSLAKLRAQSAAVRAAVGPTAVPLINNHAKDDETRLMATVLLLLTPARCKAMTPLDAARSLSALAQLQPYWYVTSASVPLRSTALSALSSLLEQILYLLLAPGRSSYAESFHAKDLADTVRALTSLGHDLVPLPSLAKLIQAASAHALEQLPRMATHELSSIATAFARVRVPAEETELINQLFTSIATASLSLMSNTWMTQSLADLVRAFATRGISNVPLFEAVASSSSWRVTQFSARDLSHLVWAFASLHVDHEALFNGVAEASLTNITKFKSTELATIAWSFAKVDAKSGHLFDAIGATVAKNLHTCDEQTLTNIAWAFATVAEDRDCTGPLLRAVAASSSKRITLFTVQHLASLCWSFTMVRIREVAFMEALEGLLTNDNTSQLARLSSFAPQELSVIALSFGTLDIVAPSLFARMASRSESFMYEAKLKSQAVANFLFAFCLAGGGGNALPISACTSLLRLAVDMQQHGKFNQESQAQLHQCCLAMQVMVPAMRSVIAAISEPIRRQWFNAFTLQGEWASRYLDRVADTIEALASAAGDAWPYREPQREYRDEHTTGGYTIDVVLFPRIDSSSSSSDGALRPIAIEVDGSRRFDRSGRYPLAATKLKRHLLPRLPPRWRVISVTAQDWRRMTESQSQQTYLASLLDMAALQPAIAPVAAAINDTPTSITAVHTPHSPHSPPSAPPPSTTANTSPSVGVSNDTLSSS